jgi:hypothetical protein
MTDEIDLTPEMIELLPSTQLRRLKEEVAALSARLAEVEAERDTWMADSAAAWDKCEERRLLQEAAEVKLASAVEGLRRIQSWADAYPLTVFPEPDFKKSRDALAAAGISLDAVSASNMRHAITGAGEIARAIIAEIGEGHE